MMIMENTPDTWRRLTREMLKELGRVIREGRRDRRVQGEIVGFFF
ncbi:MAG: hypothetical protein WA977_08835 [Halobacteriota archaeon]